MTGMGLEASRPTYGLTQNLTSLEIWSSHLTSGRSNEASISIANTGCRSMLMTYDTGSPGNMRRADRKRKSSLKSHAKPTNCYLAQKRSEGGAERPNNLSA